MPLFKRQGVIAAEDLERMLTASLMQDKEKGQDGDKTGAEIDDGGRNLINQDTRREDPHMGFPPMINETLNLSNDLGLSPGLSPRLSPGLSPRLSPGLRPVLARDGNDRPPPNVASPRGAAPQMRPMFEGAINAMGSPLLGAQAPPIPPPVEKDEKHQTKSGGYGRMPKRYQKGKIFVSMMNQNSSPSQGQLESTIFTYLSILITSLGMLFVRPNTPLKCLMAFPPSDGWERRVQIGIFRAGIHTNDKAFFVTDLTKSNKSANFVCAH